MPGQSHDADADQDADGGEHSRDHGDRTHGRQPRRQTTLGEDHDERHQTEITGQRGIVEAEPEPRLTDDHPETEEDEQAGDAEPQPEPHRERTDENHGGSDEQREVQVTVHPP